MRGTGGVLWPKHVLQAFVKITSYRKEENTHERREALTRWREAVLSRTGRVEAGALLLNERARERWGAFTHCDAVVLTDPHDPESARFREILSTRQGPDYTFLHPGERPRAYDVFSLLRTPHGWDVYLDYARHAFMIGQPRRGDYKVAELRPGRPVRVTVNGKRDFSMTGRRARTYTCWTTCSWTWGRYTRRRCAARRRWKR